ncbi:hypothetical protein [Rhizobium sp. 18055]|uniref:hypothetical protein n=1 Tax=Rhizobium sp. 18055 TaxID=2681403 RepID=UPI001358A097|nr:hypothetical protein [Rhizobium sp. 18055]
MFFLGGMTMGYFAPPAKSAKRASALFKMAKRNRKAEAKKNTPYKDSAVERSLIWAWHTIC